MLAFLLSVLLTGTPMGSSPSVDYSTGQSTTTQNTFANAFDGDLKEVEAHFVVLGSKINFFAKKVFTNL